MAVSNFPSPTDIGRTSTSSAPSPFQQDSPNFPHRTLQGRNSTPALSSGFGAPMPSALEARGKKPKKSKGFKTTARKSARWQLGEDMISGQFFRKVEVDEFLTPDRLESLRVEREAQSQPRRSSDTLSTTSTDDSETPLEPFHLQDLPSRIGAAGVKVTVPPAADVVVPPSPLNPGGRLERALKKKSSRRKKPVTNEEYEGEGPLTNGEVGVPLPPAKNPARFLARPQAPLLPTIPEVIVTTPGTGKTPVDRSNKMAARSFAPVDKDGFVFFQSTDYTLNHPMFRHGPIRFPRTEVVKGMKIDPDDTLDWTAFQMAILGGAGYLSSDSTDFTRLPENEEAADLASWFHGFCFDSPGTLITSDKRARSPKESLAVPAMLSPSPFPRPTADSELPIPVGSEYPTGFWNESAVSVSKIPKSGRGIRRWTTEGHLKRFNRESVGSLPPSPMMDLVVMRDSGGELEVVPMGYNLRHDLEDFLKWEAENVCVLGMH
ncbi:uncharacterized protein GLRG_00563 [Colletotrichum graminicola M1.001]|uniref:Uncharacterized protein n=1 Tax=Colletotrichum graminicola (strain M1.001 / M2 / FGSC 10212) TaxID=645133 RepID=E3Q4A7_COLGM|nr:uncharacterized protein GLRG_00563 [Colletotrichum graminicola M1.001]EFQ25419.1 hypothetical protein GLRG_00563 [Colletotrichum graminicola M1.001]